MPLELTMNLFISNRWVHPATMFFDQTDQSISCLRHGNPTLHHRLSKEFKNWIYHFKRSGNPRVVKVSPFQRKGRFFRENRLHNRNQHQPFLQVHSQCIPLLQSAPFFKLHSFTQIQQPEQKKTFSWNTKRNKGFVFFTNRNARQMWSLFSDLSADFLQVEQSSSTRRARYVFLQQTIHCDYFFILRKGLRIIEIRLCLYIPSWCYASCSLVTSWKKCS